MALQPRSVCRIQAWRGEDEGKAGGSPKHLELALPFLEAVAKADTVQEVLDPMLAHDKLHLKWVKQGIDETK